MARERKPNPALYRELSEPFHSEEDATVAIKAFLADVEESRKKHHIPDVLTVVQVNAIASTLEELPEGVFQSTLFLGNPINELALAAFAFGRAKQETSDWIAAIAKQAGG